jgi:hypothetical protein
VNQGTRHRAASLRAGLPSLLSKPLLLLACTAPPAVSAPAIPAGPAVAVMQGCEGEGCGCLRAYAQARSEGRSTDFAVPTLRPITLHAQAFAGSPVRGRFEPGTLATAGRQFIVLRDRGAHVVAANPGRVKGLRVGDRLDTLLSEGEGEVRARKRGQWVAFHVEQVELRTLRETRSEAWTEVTVGGQRGFTPNQPFEGCLE